MPYFSCWLGAHSPVSYQVLQLAQVYEGAAFFLGLDLPAVSYIASEAVTALGMHLTKTIVYQKDALIGIWHVTRHRNDYWFMDR